MLTTAAKLEIAFFIKGPSVCWSQPTNRYASLHVRRRADRGGGHG